MDKVDKRKRKRRPAWTAGARHLQTNSQTLRNWLAAIVQSSDDAIVSKDLNGVVTSWNAGAERLFGYTAAEMIGQPITRVIPKDRLAEEPQVLSRIRRGEAIEHYETVRCRKDGTPVEISLSVSPVLDADGKVVGASKIARDITERKHNERMLADADRRKDEFLATLSHELRNPLSTLATGVELLRSGAAQTTAPTGIVEAMGRQVNHLVRLVDDLMEVSRLSRGLIQLKQETMPIDVAVHDAIEMTRPLIEAGGQRLEITLASQQLLVQADRIRLTQVIANLLNNAAKFTPKDGLIRVTLEGEGNNAVVRVTDNGVGISSEQMEGIFEMFTQAHGHGRGGLGIGLALARRLLELHGGRIEAISGGANLGSEFVVRIPLVVTRDPVADDAELAPSARSAPRRVLVVDDNVDAAESIGALLRVQGHDVHLAGSGAAGLQLAESLRPDVVLLDIGMPDFDGHAVARRLRAEPWGRDLFIVAVTGWGQEGDRLRSTESGFDHHLVKPVAGATLERLFADQRRGQFTSIGTSPETP